MSGWASVARDPFARVELVRRALTAEDTGGQQCCWCGGKRPRGGLFEYGVERDARPGRVAEIPGLFCSVGCMRSYSL
jgi:hypothetical protein